ncbi:MAG: sulfite exporter TauE/SafE family protein, partial [Candidatus Cloacimonadales bacterium]
MFTTIAEGFFLGLATGSTCLATCTPIYIPYMLTEERSFLKSLATVVEISAGRFFSYLAFGALAGFAGAQISSINRTLFTSIAYILLSLYLVLSVVRTHKKSRKCHVPKAFGITKSGFLLGILTGINFCPSFLIALSKAIDLSGAFAGTQLFFGFFFGTTIFLIPIAFLGGLAKLKEMAFAAKIASILVAIWFTYAGVQGLVKYFSPAELAENSRMVEAFVPKQSITIVSSSEHWDYFSKLKAEIEKMHNGDLNLLLAEDFIEAKAPLIMIDRSLVHQNHQKLATVDYFSIEAGYPLEKMLKFMNSYAFSTSKYLQWEFTN